MREKKYHICLLYQRENVKGQNLCECDYVR